MIDFLRKQMSKEVRMQLLVFSLSLVLYLAFLADGFNFFDTVTYAMTLTQSFRTGDAFLPFTSFGAYGPGSIVGLGRSPMYVLFSYPYSYLMTSIFGVGLELALNTFSALIVALSCLFVYKISRLYLNSRDSMKSVLLYVFMPIVFFLGINSFNYSLVILFSAAWLYYLLLFFKTSEKKYMYISSALLVANIYTHQIAIPLLLPQAYFIFRRLKKFGWMWLAKNSAIFAPAAALIYYFTFVNPAIPVKPSLSIIAFEAAILSWELVNGLSLVFFMLSAAAMFLLLFRILKKRLDDFDILFLLTFIGLLSILFYFNDIPVIRFIAILPILPLFVIMTMKRYKSFGKYFNFLIYVSLVFMLVKFLPIAYQFHAFPHPHQAYSEWLAGFNSTTVIVGHECPYVIYYTKLNVICKSAYEMNVTLPSAGVYVTQEYFKNENEMEFDYMQKLIPLPFNSAIAAQISKFDLLSGRNVTKFAEYPAAVRNFEDGFQWLFTVYPNPVENTIFNIAFIKPQYAIYKVS